MSGYYEIRPIVIAVLALALAQATEGGTAKDLIEGAFVMEDLLFAEAAKRPRKSSYPEGKYVDRDHPTPPPPQRESKG